MPPRGSQSSFCADYPHFPAASGHILVTNAKVQIDKGIRNSYNKGMAKNTNALIVNRGDETHMKNLRRSFSTLAAIAIVLIPLLITVYLLYWCPADLSARQTGQQRVFGATYMTMNNPYFQMLDAQIQGHLEWVLKRPEYKYLSENNSSSEVCPNNPDLLPLLKAWITEVLELHADSKFIHLGADETWFLGTCPICSKQDKIAVYLDHVSKICSFVLEQGRIPMIWADVFQRENRTEEAGQLPAGTILVDWQYSGTPPYPGTEILMKSGHEVMGASGAMIGWWEHCLQVISEFQSRIDNVTGWNKWAEEHQSGIIHTTWTRGATLWNIYGCWLGVLPVYIAAGNPAVWETHPWKQTIRKISEVIKGNQIDQLEQIFPEIEALPTENPIEEQAKKWIYLAVRYQQLQQEFQIHRATRRIITETSKFVGFDSSMFQHDCVEPLEKLLPKLDQWEKDARTFWKENELSEEEEFMATHINLIRRDVTDCLNMKI